MAESTKQDLRYRPLLILLGLSVLARIGLFAFTSPGIIYSWDSTRFARTVPGFESLFSDYWMPAGYPYYLTVTHALSDQLWVPIAGQHLLGLGAAVALFLALRRLELSRAVATIGSAVLLVPGDLIFLEHALLIESLMLSFTVLACCAAIRGLVPTVDWRWLVAAGVLAGAAMVLRNIGLIVIPVLIGVALFATAKPWRARLTSGAAVAAGAAIVLAIYAGAFQASGGRYAGISDMSGWYQYSRVAPFADCSQFTPPEGTKQFCDKSEISKRPGPVFYIWYRKPAPVPETDALAGEFARAVVKAQPGGYVIAVSTDLARYVGPTIGGGDRGATGSSYMEFDSAALTPSYIKLDRNRLAKRYSGTDESRRGINVLGSYQRIVRIHGLLLPLMAIVAIAGLIKVRGPRRIAITMFLLISAGVLILPTMTFTYSYRYGVASGALLAIAALIATASIVESRSRDA